jgi:DNA-binding response OmpR family regulator
MSEKRPVILIVDDDPDILDTFRLILEKHDYVMVGAETAEDGLREYKEKKPDLIIVDLMMEEVDSGTGFVRDLQALGNQAPVYMLSSIGDSLHASTDYVELGLSGIFQKPINSETLLTTLRIKLRS